MTYEQNVRAILECNFVQTKDEFIDTACENICELSRWNPCSEGDPKEDGRYLCSDKKGDISIFCYTSNLYKLDEYDFREFKHKKDKSGWYSYDSEYGYFEVDGVAAWRTLPEGYEEVNE